MAAIGLEDVADQAVAAALRLVIAEMEAPEGWHLSRIAVHSLEERPHQHEEEDVVEDHE